MTPKTISTRQTESDAPHPGRRQPAQRDDERRRIKEVAVAELEPSTPVVEQSRDEDGDGRAEEQPRPGRRQSARIASSSPGVVTKTDIPSPSGRKNGKSADRPSAGGAGSTAGSSPTWESENRPCSRELVEERRQRGQRVAGFERVAEPDDVVREEPDDRRQHAGRQQRPTRATGSCAAVASPRVQPRQRAAGRRTGSRTRRGARVRNAAPASRPIRQRPLPAPQLDQAGQRQDRRDQVAGVPDAAARGDPQDLGGEPEQQDQPAAVDQPADAEPADQPPAQADARGGQRAR